MTGRPSEHGRYGPVAPGATESNPAAEQVDKTRRVLAHLEALERDARTIVAEGRQAFTRMINRRAALSVIIDVSSAIEKLPATFKGRFGVFRGSGLVLIRWLAAGSGSCATLSCTAICWEW